ncbi:unnamed protein product [Urochloa humidicola]
MASPRPAGAVVAGDEAIWGKLREAGFDEDAVRRQDRAALIGYISRLESEGVGAIAAGRTGTTAFIAHLQLRRSSPSRAVSCTAWTCAYIVASKSIFYVT